MRRKAPSCADGTDLGVSGSVGSGAAARSTMTVQGGGLWRKGMWCGAQGRERCCRGQVLSGNQYQSICDAYRRMPGKRSKGCFPPGIAMTSIPISCRDGPALRRWSNVARRETRSAVPTYSWLYASKGPGPTKHHERLLTQSSAVSARRVHVEYFGMTRILEGLQSITDGYRVTRRSTSL